MLLLFVERISVKKLMIALGIGAGLTAFNFLFGQSLNAGKYVTSTMLFVYCGHYRDGLGIPIQNHFRAHITTERFCVFYLVVGMVFALAAVEMAQIIIPAAAVLWKEFRKYLICGNSYVLNFINLAVSVPLRFILNRHFRFGTNLNLAEHQSSLVSKHTEKRCYILAG